MNGTVRRRLYHYILLSAKHSKPLLNYCLADSNIYMVRTINLFQRKVDFLSCLDIFTLLALHLSNL